MAPSVFKPQLRDGLIRCTGIDCPAPSQARIVPKSATVQALAALMKEGWGEQSPSARIALILPSGTMNRTVTKR